MKITATRIGLVLSAALLVSGCEKKQTEPTPDTARKEEQKPAAAAPEKSEPKAEEKKEAKAEEKKEEKAEEKSEPKAEEKKSDSKDAKKDGKAGSCGAGQCGH